MADLLNIGISGLLASQQALTTTSHNISNVNTAGYSRQSVDMAARLPQATGAGYFGQGVDVGNVQRAYNGFLVENLRSNVSSYSRLDAYAQLATQVDNVLADPNAGLSPVLQDFFAAVQGVADNPSSVASRQVMLSSGEALAQRFNSLEERFSSLGDRVNRQMDASVGVVNELARSLAELNKQIVRYTGAAGGRQPNDLLDKRDLLLQQLAEHVPVKAVAQDDGAVNVFIGTGQALVVGGNTSQLALRSSEFPDTPKRIYLVGATGKGTGIDVTSAINGGSLGGSLDFVREVLEPSRAELGRVAAGLAESLNEQHRLGTDLLGVLGDDFFSRLGKVAAVSGTNNASATTSAFSSNVTDVTKLTTSDYRLDYNGTAYTLTRLSDHATWTAPGGLTPGQVLFDLDATDGLTFTVDSVGVEPVAGDSFLFRPTSRAAAGINVEIEDPAKIAAAGALIAQQLTDANGYPANGGDGSLRSLVARDDKGALATWPAAGSIALQFQDNGTAGVTSDDSYAMTAPGAAWTVSLLDADGNVVVAPANSIAIPYDVANDAGAAYTVRLANGAGETVDLDFELHGTPVNGDQLIVGANTSGIADNRNALALGELQMRKVLDNATAGFQGAYSRIVSTVGTRTHQATVGAESQLTLKRQAEEAKESVSGVNLDEEAANLIKFQQAYQATAQIITVANSLFDTLLATVR